MSGRFSLRAGTEPHPYDSIRPIRVQRCATILAGDLIPTERSAARARPARCLFGQPLCRPLAFQVLELIDDRPVVNAPVPLEGLEPIAGERVAEAAVQHVFFLSTRPDLALGTPGVDVEGIGAASTTGVALERTAPASGFSQEVPALGKGSAIVVARAAIKATYGEQVEIVHRSALIN